MSFYEIIVELIILNENVSFNFENNNLPSFESIYFSEKIRLFLTCSNIKFELCNFSEIY